MNFQISEAVTKYELHSQRVRHKLHELRAGRAAVEDVRNVPLESHTAQQPPTKDFPPVGCSGRGFTQLLSTLQGKCSHADGHTASLGCREKVGITRSYKSSQTCSFLI